MLYRMLFPILVIFLLTSSVLAQSFDAANAIEISQDGTNMDVEWGAPPMPQPTSSEVSPRILPTTPSRHDDLKADIGESGTALKAQKFVTNYCYPDCSGCGYKSTVCQSVSYHYMQSFCASSGVGGLLPGATPSTFAAVEKAAQHTQESDNLAGCYFMIADLLDVCDTLCPNK